MIIAVDWIFMSSQNSCWSTNPQCSSIWRWGVWEVIRFKWDHEGWNSVMELVTLYKKRKRPELSRSPPWEDTARLTANQEESSHQTKKSAETLNFDFLVSRIMRNVSCISHPVYGNLFLHFQLNKKIIQLKHTKNTNIIV